MTLTLEDVKNVRFPIAKRVGEGYRATEVDDFVDKVDMTFGTILEENERLRAQLEALDSDAQDSGLQEENDRLRAELEQARKNTQAPAAAPVAAAPNKAQEAELQRLREENHDLRRQMEALSGELESARQSTALTVMDGQNGSKIEKIVVSTAAQASPAVTRLVQLATEQAESVVTEAENEALRKLEEAKRQAHELTLDAQTRAERTQSEARVNADQLTAAAKAEAQRLAAEARTNSERVNSDVENRRRELFAKLEAERDELVGKVDQLRSFEGQYRQNMTAHFTSMLDKLKGEKLEPSDAPVALSEVRANAAQGSSATPRLDALLAEGN
ncbi:DivIVA domain-containing protein [Luteococcus sp. Sow4_B9]|uniref:DivIVA domain-containing protein n=1 Tax=Luteococcus sp. Sow4_B9 TaxID=3438792 RepID=UPI003F99B679